MSTPASGRASTIRTSSFRPRPEAAGSTTSSRSSRSTAAGTSTRRGSTRTTTTSTTRRPTDGGQHWTAPLQVSGGDAHSNVMPWVQGGAAGTLAVAWYGNGSNVDSDFMPSWYANRQGATAFKWYGYAVAAHRSHGRHARPSPSSASRDQPMHYGQICTGGIGCSTNPDSGPDDGRLLRVRASIRATARCRIVFNDTTSQHHGAHLYEVRQVGGPSALGGTVSRSVPSNPVSDPTGDAQSPHYGAERAGREPAAVRLHAAPVEPSGYRDAAGADDAQQPRRRLRRRRARPTPSG